MLFNSLQFGVFFFVVYLVYLSLGRRWQNRALLVASYVFYGSWDWRFLSLLLISTVVDYLCGLRIDQARDPRARKRFLILSVATNLGLLGFFKYWNFFIDSAERALGILGVEPQLFHLDIILPVGISFYTFQSMSYTIDVYRGQLQPTRRFLDFALYVAFFPQLVAGPIERARNLLPQMLDERVLCAQRIKEGIGLIGWGLFKKVLIADNLAFLVDGVFENYSTLDGASILIGMYAFAFQIYCDFSGYTDIARGVAKMMGFELMLNFRLPYFARNPSDFWRRWHISLSSWLRDYLYIPLGGNRAGRARTYLNLLLTMLLGGLWHGAAWTFVVWGGYHGLLLVVHRLSRPLRERAQGRLTFRSLDLGKWLSIFVMFHLTCIGWLIFRSQSMEQVLGMSQGLLGSFWVSRHAVELLWNFGYFVSLLVVIQILQYRTNDLSYFFRMEPVPKLACLLVASFLIFYVLVLGRNAGIGGGNEFIYFQF